MEKQTRLTKDLEEKRNRAEEERKHLEHEMQEAEKEHRKALHRVKLDKKEMHQREEEMFLFDIYFHS